LGSARPVVTLLLVGLNAAVPTCVISLSAAPTIVASCATNDPEEFLVVVPDPETVAFCAFGVPVPLLVITVVPDAEDS